MNYAKVRITGNYIEGSTLSTSGKVATIKLIRAITGLGLKEAKEASEEMVEARGHTLTLSGYKDLDVNGQVSEFERNGIKVERLNDLGNPRDLLRTATETELARGNFEQAAAITRILADYYS